MEQASFECSGTRSKERPSRAVVRVTGAHLSGRYSCNNKMAWRSHSLVTSVSESFSVFLNVGGQLPVPSHSGEPIVSAILPKPPGKAVSHEDRRDPLRILEPELCRDAQLERIAVARCQDFVGNLEGEKRLRVQRRGHVDAGVISVGALEADIFRRQVRADAL